MWSTEQPNEREGLQVEGLRESVRYLLQVVKSEGELVGLEKTVLGGITQGCATAIHALFNMDVKLSGFVGLCSWLPFQESISEWEIMATLRVPYKVSRESDI